MMSLDGFFEGEHNDIRWHKVDDEFNAFALAQLEHASHLVFGRMTYELMAQYWPTNQAKSDDPAIAKRMNEMVKIVCSHTLSTSDWHNTYICQNLDELSSFKNQAGKDILVLGSANLCKTLIQHKLIDLYRVMINPVILSKGNPLFQNLSTELNLKLVNCKSFKSGNILVEYELNV